MRVALAKPTFPFVAAGGLAGVLLAVGGGLILVLPDRRELILFGLYAVPSHTLISPFPIEPPLLYFAKTNPPLLVAGLALLGCLLSGFFDYLLLMPLLHHRALRPKYENTRFFRKGVAFFHRSPFLLLIVVHLTPIPFYPFKFLSIASKYRFWRYQVAAVIGRAPRYYILAWFGHTVELPNWALVALVLVFLALFYTRYRRARVEMEASQVTERGR